MFLRSTHIAEQYLPAIQICYNGPLRRQICEAVNIVKLGSLNRKNEFDINQLCLLEPAKSTYDQEKTWRNEFDNRKCDRENLNNFCAVMQDIHLRC